MDSKNIFVGRQPIYNPNLGVFAYELLFRSDEEVNRSEFTISGDQATAQVFVNTFFEMGLDNVVGEQLACINLGENYSLWNEMPVLQAERIILDIPPSIEVNNQSIEAVQALKDAGYTLALNDFTNNPAMSKLVEYATIIRIDVRENELLEIKSKVKAFAKYNKNLLADKVENLDDFDALNAMGFNYFQGYFLSRPKIVIAKGLPNNKLSIMNLLAALNDVQAEPEELVKAIDHDASLSYKMLKLINSAGFGLSQKIESMHHAIVMLGRRQLAAWASMLALGSLNDRPPEMIHLCMIRAKTCELLAQAAGIKESESYFTVGLFSALDILMERSLTSILKPLPLSDDIMLALIEKKGLKGEALSATLAFEISDWDKVKFQGLSNGVLVKVNMQAYRWANEVAKSLR